MRRLLAFTFTLLAISLPAFAGNQDLAGIAGNYVVTGSNPGGGTYSGTATITLRDDGQYDVTQYISGDTWTGTGAFSNQQLVVTYASFNVGAIYVLQPSGVLSGTWGTLNGPYDGREDLTPSR